MPWHWCPGMLAVGTYAPIFLWPTLWRVVSAAQVGSVGLVGVGPAGHRLCLAVGKHLRHSPSCLPPWRKETEGLKWTHAEHLCNIWAPQNLARARYSLREFLHSAQHLKTRVPHGPTLAPQTLDLHANEFNNWLPKWDSPGAFPSLKYLNLGANHFIGGWAGGGRGCGESRPQLHEAYEARTRVGEELPPPICRHSSF